MNETFVGFYLGVFFIIILYHFQWYLNTKQKSYLYYIFMHLSIIFLTLEAKSISGHTMIFLAAICAIIFTVLFSKEFLNLKNYYKQIDKIIKNAIGLFLVISAFLYFFEYMIIIKYLPFSILFGSFLILGFMVYKKGFVLAKYFILAWLLYIPFLFIGDLSRIFSIQLFDFDYMFQMGNILEATVLSFALMEKTTQLIKEKEQKDKLLIHQARLVALGEMLANISHQWRQPLNRIASFIINMQMHIMDNYKEEKYLNEKLEQTQEQLEYMSHTIDDFANFYKKDQPKVKFLASQAIKDALKIINPSMKAKNIEIKLEVMEDFSILSYQKELAQVILNLLQNAKDALEIKKIENPKIQIELKNKTISIQDNAKGVDESLIDKIFDPYFTTKQLHKGTGLGLYMSKLILEKNFKATIKVKNTKKGAKFSILF